MLNTISQLNERMWFRILKVIYLVVFSFLILFTLLIIYLLNRLPDNYLSQKELLRGLDEYAKTRGSYEQFKQYRVDDNHKYIWQVFDCEGKPKYKNIFEMYANEYVIEEINDKKTIATLGNYAKQEFKEYKKYSDYEIGNKLYEKILKDKAIKGSGYIFNSIKYSTVFVLLWMVIFEIIRRIFYYIVLGKLFPPPR